MQLHDIRWLFGGLAVAFFAAYMFNLNEKIKSYDSFKKQEKYIKSSIDTLVREREENKKKQDSLLLMLFSAKDTLLSPLEIKPNLERIATLTRTYDSLGRLIEKKRTEVNSSGFNFVDTIDIVFLLVFALCFLLAIVGVNDVWDNFGYQLKRLSSVYVFNYIKVRIQYLDTTGNRVSIKRHDHISKISYFRNKGVSEIPFALQGTISKDETYAVNGAFTFPNEGKVVFHRYFSPYSFVRRQHFSSYVFVAENSFCSDSEFWIFTVKEFCLFYRVEVILPAAVSILDVRLCRRDLGKKAQKLNESTEESISILDSRNEPGWVEYEKPVLLIVKELDTTTISVNLAGLRKEDCFKLSWDIKR